MTFTGKLVPETVEISVFSADPSLPHDGPDPAPDRSVECRRDRDESCTTGAVGSEVHVSPLEPIEFGPGDFVVVAGVFFGTIDGDAKTGSASWAFTVV